MLQAHEIRLIQLDQERGPVLSDLLFLFFLVVFHDARLGLVLVLLGDGVLGAGRFLVLFAVGLFVVFVALGVVFFFLFFDLFLFVDLDDALAVSLVLVLLGDGVVCAGWGGCGGAGLALLCGGSCRRRCQRKVLDSSVLWIMGER